MIFDDTILLNGTRPGGIPFFASLRCRVVDDGLSQEFDGVDGAAPGIREMTAFVRMEDWPMNAKPQVGDRVSIEGDWRRFRVMTVNEISGKINTMRLRQC